MDKLNQLRQEIDHIDQTLFALIGERARVAAEMGAIKRESGLPIRDFVREKQVLEQKLKDYADLCPNLVQKVVQALIEDAIRIQETEHQLNQGPKSRLTETLVF